MNENENIHINSSFCSHYKVFAKLYENRIVKTINFTARCTGILGLFIDTDEHIDTKGFTKSYEKTYCETNKIYC